VKVGQDRVITGQYQCPVTEIKREEGLMWPKTTRSWVV